MNTPNDPRTKEIYRKLMLAMEGKGMAYGTDILRIPVLDNAPASFPDPALDPKGSVASRTLRFRIMKGLGNTAFADSMDKEGVRIAYDPNWEVYAKIDALLAEVK